MSESDRCEDEDERRLLQELLVVGRFGDRFLQLGQGEAASVISSRSGGARSSIASELCTCSFDSFVPTTKHFQSVAAPAVGARFATSACTRDQEVEINLKPARH